MGQLGAAMDLDDLFPDKPKDPLQELGRQDLDPFSVDELEKRIATLNLEIERCEGKIAFANRHRSVADALFKK